MLCDLRINHPCSLSLCQAATNPLTSTPAVLCLHPGNADEHRMSEYLLKCPPHLVALLPHFKADHVSSLLSFHNTPEQLCPHLARTHLTIPHALFVCMELSIGRRNAIMSSASERGKMRSQNLSGQIMNDEWEHPCQTNDNPFRACSPISPTKQRYLRNASPNLTFDASLFRDVINLRARGLSSSVLN